MNLDASNELQCPYCGTIWELTAEEAKAKTFTCDECKRPCLIHQEAYKESLIRRILFKPFLVRHGSKASFVFVMASCAYTLNAFIARLVTMFQPHAPSGFVNPLGVQKPLAAGVVDGLLFSPILESLTLVGIIELTRLFKAPYFLQLLLSAGILCVFHAHGFPARSLIVAPLFLICSYSYLYWRSDSWKMAFLLIVFIHSTMNINPFLDFVIRKANAEERQHPPRK